MKSPLDESAVAAIATSALFHHYNPDGDSLGDPDFRAPEELAYNITREAVPGSLSLEDSPCYDAGFVFGLQLGARIGANPLQRPEVADLVKVAAETLRRNAEPAAA